MKRKTSYCRYQQKSLSAATAALLNHLISFLKKVQVHFGQDKLKNRKLLKIFQDKELQEISPGLIKMCSVASSSRLCFINFANYNEIEFERPLSTGKGTAKLDASKYNLFYECKCHEIFDNHNNYLSLAYKENLKEFFNINYQKNDNAYCKLNLTDFEIEKEESIYNLHFDMKQFLCHLFGIAKNGGGTLQYIFFFTKKRFN